MSLISKLLSISSRCICEVVGVEIRTAKICSDMSLDKTIFCCIATFVSNKIRVVGDIEFGLTIAICEELVMTRLLPSADNSRG